MIKKCETHQKYEEKFICIHKTRLLKEGNKFSCQKCINWKKSDDFIKCVEEVEEEAKEHVAKYVEMQNKIINLNNEMKQKYIQQLNDLQQKLNQYFQKQQKTITSLIEQQNQTLSQNINKANSLLNQQSVLDSQSIDNFIIFITLNEVNQQIIENKYTQINNCLGRQFNYEFTEIECKVNQFITMEFKFDSVPYYEVEQFKIQNVDKKKDQQPYCKVHQIEKNCICTHEDCLKEQKQEYICLGCAVNNHEQHFQGNFVKTLKKIKNEQFEKLKLIEEQNKLLKQEVNNRIDQELIANQQKQQEIFICSQTTRENLKLLETKTKVDPFNKNPIYIFHSIDQNLLSSDADMIKLEFQSKLDQLEQLKQNISTIQKEEFNQQCQSTDEQTQVYKQETIKLKKLMSQYETKISELKTKSADQIIAEIKDIYTLCTSKFRLQQQNSEQINQQIGNLLKAGIGAQQWTSFQQELKNCINKLDLLLYQLGSNKQNLSSTRSIDDILKKY